VTGPGGQVVHQAAFVEKPWCDNFAAFVADHPEARWIVAQSPRPCTTASEAQQEALRDGAMKLSPDVRRLIRSIGSSFVSNQAGVEQTLQSGLQSYVADRFVQGFSRPYGQVWREAILIDASDRTITSLASACERQIRSERRSWARTVGSIAGLFVLICLVYVFLNVLTKGYYTRGLRVVAAGMVLVGVAATLFAAWYVGS
jgi:hypothetical protein